MIICRFDGETIDRFRATKKKKKKNDNTFGTKKERIFTLLKSGELTKEQGTGNKHKVPVGMLEK